MSLRTDATTADAGPADAGGAPASTSTADATSAVVTGPGPARRGRARGRLGDVVAAAWPIAVALLGIVAIWYVVSYLVLPEDQRFLLPPPHEVYAGALGDVRVLGPMLDARGNTVVVAMAGLALAAVVGIGWAVLMSLAGWVEKVLYPYAVILQTIPILALVPLIGIWFGYGFPARVIVCVIIALFPMISTTLFGLRSAGTAAHDLFTLHRAGRFQRLAHLTLPAAVPSMFTGLRTAAGLSVIGALVGDYFFQQGPAGIGGLLRTYTLRLQMDALFTAITLTALFGVVVFAIFAVLDSVVIGRWYGPRT
ncbi:MAG: ABC transporter permease [Actinomycetaceae bacterium]